MEVSGVRRRIAPSDVALRHGAAAKGARFQGALGGGSFVLGVGVWAKEVFANLAAFWVQSVGVAILQFLDRVSSLSTARSFNVAHALSFVLTRVALQVAVTRGQP